MVNADPLFASGTAPYDVHLKSFSGRWDGSAWVIDVGQISPAIDRGDPDSSYSLEPAPNGSRINMGAYGGTAEASKTRGPDSTYFMFK
jgi:hypothetical protein